MENAFSKFEELIGSVRAYVDLRIAQVKVEFAEKVSSLFANLIAAVMLALFLTIFLIFASITGAILLNQCLCSAWAGYAIIAVLYLLLGCIIWLAKGRLIQVPVMNALIHQLFKEEHEAD